MYCWSGLVSSFVLLCRFTQDLVLFEVVHTAITQIRMRDHGLQQHRLPTAAFRGLVVRHHQRFHFLPPRRRLCRRTLFTSDECSQDGPYGLRRAHTAFCCVEDGTNCDRPRPTVPVIIAQPIVLDGSMLWCAAGAAVAQGGPRGTR